MTENTKAESLIETVKASIPGVTVERDEASETIYFHRGRLTRTVYAQELHQQRRYPQWTTWVKSIICDLTLQ
jgi:hypothetical protein